MYPAAVSRGISKHDFFHSTPRDIEIFVDEYDKNKKTELEMISERMNYSSWLTGLYIQSAVASVLSNKARYPDKPYGTKDTDAIEVTEDMTDEEKSLARQALLDSLLGMQEQFNQTHMKTIVENG